MLMATELLFEAYTKYIEPLLEFGWVHLNNNGFIVEREYGYPIYYTNDKYKGLPGEVPRIYPVVPLSDEHYLAIKENPEQEVFNPFYSFKYMQLVMMEFKRGLITSCISEEASKTKTLEEQEELIRFYYEKQDSMYTVGFINVENEGETLTLPLKPLYSYSSPDIVSAIWGLCVTAYNNEDRKHADYFYNIEKAWTKAKRLSEKWEEERRKILPKIKIIQQESVGFQHIDLSDGATNKITEYPQDYFVGQQFMDQYLLSLFDATGLEVIPGYMTEGPNSPISRQERVWQYPDFASDEVIFAKTNKVKKEKNAKELDTKGYEVDEIDRVIDDNTSHGIVKLIPPPPDQASPNPPENEAAEGINRQQQPKQPFTSSQIPPFNPYNNPYGPYGTPYNSMGYPQMPGQPMYPIGHFGYPFPMYNQMQTNVPQDIEQIDFEIHDHPDPFSKYK
jgi:hypothetical protein